MVNCYITTFFRGNIEKNVELTEHNKTNVLGKRQNTRYIFYARKCRELTSQLNGTITYNMILMKALYLN